MIPKLTKLACDIIGIVKRGDGSCNVLSEVLLKVVWVGKCGNYSAELLCLFAGRDEEVWEIMTGSKGNFELMDGLNMVTNKLKESTPKVVDFVQSFLRKLGLRKWGFSEKDAA